MRFFQNHRCKEQEVLHQLKLRELTLENLINKYRIFLFTFLLITDYLVMHFFGGLNLSYLYVGLPGMVLVYFGFYKLHRITQKNKPKPGLKYITVVLDYFIVFGGFMQVEEIMRAATNISMDQFLLFASILFIIINTLSALKVQVPVIMFSTLFGIMINSILHVIYGSNIIIIIYTDIFILITGFFNRYLSQFIFQFFVTHYRLNATLGNLKEANEEIKAQYEEINAKNDELATQNDYLSKQRDEIAQQKKQITSSIAYASRIQAAVLDFTKEIDAVAPDSFILFHPKDIVSGDFYWFKKVEVFTKNYHVFTAVDCTGHGVPGAFMSMLGTSFLNEIVTEFYDELNAAQILNRMRQEVKKHLHQTDDNKRVKDGMDMALCAIDYEDMKLQFSGANNPLYIIRNLDGKPANEVEEIKPDKMPIGVYIKEKESFTNHVIDINKGDLLYVFSDGFIDQFGGDTGEKFKKRRLRQLLLSVAHLPMSEQHKRINQVLKNWMGENYDQIDDITLIGVRV